MGTSKLIGKSLQYYVTVLVVIYFVISFIEWKVNILSSMSTWDPVARGFMALALVVGAILSYCAVYNKWFD